MPTYQQQLLQAAQSRLQSLTLVPAARVLIDRPDPVGKDDCPAITLELNEGRVQQVIGSEGVHDLLAVRAELLITAFTRGDPHTLVADPIVAELHAALMADPSLGGLAQRLSYQRTQPRRVPSDGTAGVFELTYEATVVVDERTLSIYTG